MSRRRPLRSVARRLLLPAHWVPLARRLVRTRRRDKAADDAQLKLYGQILPAGFLNYGYHDDPAVPPAELSFAAIERAQRRYGERLVAHVTDRQAPVLDAGCGMGGLIRLLLEAGLAPTGLTPNRTQIARVRADFPAVPLIEARLEALPVADHRGAFGTVITSESLQYMDLAAAVAVIDAVLRPGGRWIVCDYFRAAPTARRSGHAWSDFTATTAAAGWRIVAQEDITANVLPTIGFAHMVGTRVGLPLARYLAERLERRQPALHYLAEEAVADLLARLQDQLDIVDPALFAAEKRYMTVVLER